MYKEGANPFEYMLNNKCQIVTTDGRIFVGILRGIDQALNSVLQDSEERIYSQDGVQHVPMALQVVRGDSVAVIGELDMALEERLNFAAIKANPLLPINN